MQLLLSWQLFFILLCLSFLITSFLAKTVFVRFLFRYSKYLFRFLAKLSYYYLKLIFLLMFYSYKSERLSGLSFLDLPSWVIALISCSSTSTSRFLLVFFIQVQIQVQWAKKIIQASVSTIGTC